MDLSNKQHVIILEMNRNNFSNVLTATDVRPPGFEPVSEHMLADIVNRIVAGIKP